MDSMYDRHALCVKSTLGLRVQNDPAFAQALLNVNYRY